MAKRKTKRSKTTKVINLKKLAKGKSDTALKSALKQASSRKIAIIVLNAPFKLAA